MYCYVPLYIEDSIVKFTLRFEMPEEFQKPVTSVNATPVLDDALADAAIKTRQACHQTALTFLTAGEGVAKSTFESASEVGDLLAMTALLSINAAEIWSQRGNLLLEEVVDRLKPMAEAGVFAAIYDTFLRFELDAGNVENQKKSVPYLTMAAMLDPRAMIRMGEVQEQGFYGVKPDKKKAEMYYEEGTRILSLLASQGLPCAAVELGRVYLEELGTKQDTPRAERYYRFAQKSGYVAPEFWFWENYGIAMRQMRIRQEFIQSDEGKEIFQGRNKSSEFLERSVPNSSKNPQNCIYLIREKKSVLFMDDLTRSGREAIDGLVNVKVANLCWYLFNVIQENYNNRDKPSIGFSDRWEKSYNYNYDARFNFKGNKQ